MLCFGFPFGLHSKYNKPTDNLPYNTCLILFTTDVQQIHWEGGFLLKDNPS